MDLRKKKILVAITLVNLSACMPVWTPDVVLCDKFEVKLNGQNVDNFCEVVDECEQVLGLTLWGSMVEFVEPQDVEQSCNLSYEVDGCYLGDWSDLAFVAKSPNVRNTALCHELLHATFYPHYDYGHKKPEWQKLEGL